MPRILLGGMKERAENSGKLVLCRRQPAGISFAAAASESAKPRQLARSSAGRIRVELDNAPAGYQAERPVFSAVSRWW